jgi:polyisoprenoid-binding protein YceI
MKLSIYTRTALSRGIFGTLTLAAVLVATAGAPSTANAQMPGVDAGAKRVTLNDAIRPNQFEWLSDAPMEKIKGSAPGVTGTFTIDPAKLAEITGKISVPVKTMKTGNPLRDRHLADKDWLDAASFPNITYDIKKTTVRKVEAGKAELMAEGTFTLHGVGKEMSIPVTLQWKNAGADTARVPGDWVKISVKFNVKLGDFKVVGKSGVVGKKVGDTIAVTGTLYGHTVK